MDAVTAVAAAILFLTFAVSFCAKVADFSVFTSSLASFGVSSNLVPLVSALIMIGEAAICVSVVFAPLVVSGIIAICLLFVFTIILVASLARGQSLRCACFGNVGNDPISYRTVARNIGLIAISIWLLTEPRSIFDVVDAMTRAEAIDALLLAVIAVLLLALYLVLQRYGEALKTLDAVGVRSSAYQADLGLPEGSQLPDLTLVDGAGAPIQLRQLVRETGSRSIVLLSETCPHCSEVIPYIADAASTGQVGLVIVSGKTRHLYDQLSRALERGWSLALAPNEDALSAFQAVGYPALIPVGERGEAQGGVVLGLERIRQFLAAG